MKLAVALVALLTIGSCADRERINCPRQKNKAPRASVVEATTTTAAPEGRCLE